MKKSRLVLLFSAVVLLISAMCIGIGAEGNEAKIGDTEYATLYEAMNAVSENGTVVLLTDCTAPGNMNVGGASYNIDGNGNSLTFESSWWGSRKITFTNITIYTKGVQIGDTAKMTLGNGAVLTAPSGASQRHLFQMVGSAEIVMEGGSEIKDAALTAMAIEPCIGNKFIMNGGKISGITGTNAFVTWGTSSVILNGGEISGNSFSSAALSINSGTSAVFGDDIIIKNNGTNKIVTASGSDRLTVSDKFAKTVGYQADGGATYYDRSMVAASVDGVPYKTLPEAISAATAGKTVLLENDSDYSGSSLNEKNITVDGQNHKMTVAADSAIWGASNITFKNITVYANNLTLGDSGKITLDEGAVLSTIPGATGAARSVLIQQTAVFTMNSGSTVKDIV